MKSIMLGRAIHGILAGIVLQVAGALLGALGGGVWSLTALFHVATAAAGTYLSAYLVRQAPSWLAWLAQQLGGAPPTSAAGILLVLVALSLASCSPPQAAAAPVLRAGPVGLLGTLVSAGDSLGPYTFAVNPVAGATGYKWTVTASATNGTWGNLPAGTATTSPSVTFTLAAVGGAWDSVSLQLCVTGTSAVRSAKAPACISWKVLRYLPSPTSLSGDSSRLGPISMMIRDRFTRLPHWGTNIKDSIDVGAGPVAWKVCAFWRFGSGHVLAVGDTLGCGPVAAAQFRADRLTGYTAAEAAWQSGACLTWGGCLSGLGLGRRLPADALLTHRA